MPMMSCAGTISRRGRKGTASNRDYLSSSIRYEDGKLVDQQGMCVWGRFVRRGWSRPCGGAAWLAQNLPIKSGLRPHAVQARR